MSESLFSQQSKIHFEVDSDRLFDYIFTSQKAGVLSGAWLLKHILHIFKLSQCMRFPTIWHFDMCRLRRASAASFKA